jgi:hypothetical protein
MEHKMLHHWRDKVVGDIVGLFFGPVLLLCRILRTLILTSGLIPVFLCDNWVITEFWSWFSIESRGLKSRV